MAQLLPMRTGALGHPVHARGRDAQSRKHCFRHSGAGSDSSAVFLRNISFLLVRAPLTSLIRVSRSQKRCATCQCVFFVHETLTQLAMLASIPSGILVLPSTTRSPLHHRFISVTLFSMVACNTWSYIVS
jgi:hypothetical protein